MSNERVPYLNELIRLSSKATLEIATFLLNEEWDEENKFKDLRDALKCLKADEKLKVTEKNIENDFTIIEIAVRDD